jgi:hypothetical protein
MDADGMTLSRRAYIGAVQRSGEVRCLEKELEAKPIETKIRPGDVGSHTRVSFERLSEDDVTLFRGHDPT